MKERRQDSVVRPVDPVMRRVVTLTRRIAPLHSPGGLERSARDVVVGMSDLGWDTLTVTSPAERPGALPGTSRFVKWGRADRSGTFYYALQYPVWIFRAALTLRKELRRGDVFHVHGSAVASLIILKRSLRRANVPVVLNPHGLEPFAASSLWSVRIANAWQRAALQHYARDCDAVIATDTSLIDPIRLALKLERNTVVYIPNAVTIPAAATGELADQAEEATVYSAQSSPLTLLSVGRMERNKGYDLLARAVATIRERLPSGWLWVHVGDGSQSAHVARLVEAAALSPNVRIIRRGSDQLVSSLMTVCDVFVQPSRHEGSSLTTLEAMSRGRAIVAARVGGIPDKITHGVSGLLVSPDDALGLAEAIEKLVTSPPLRRKYGEAAREICARHFSQKEALASYQGLFHELLSLDLSVRRRK